MKKKGKKDEEKKDESKEEIICVRIKKPVSVKDHKKCPYCFGKTADVKSKKHKKFCDFKEGEDSVTFGFPFD